MILINDYGHFLKRTFNPLTSVRDLCFEKHVSSAGLLSLIFFKLNLFLDSFILLVLQVLFPIITPVSQAE